MKRYRMPIALVITSIAMAPFCGVSAARAVTIPSTSPVSCTSSLAWVKLQAAVGERCYTGNGTSIVDLAGVLGGQIVGVHTVCLRTRPVSFHCLTGPATFRLSPPAYVQAVTIATP